MPQAMFGGADVITRDNIRPGNFKQWREHLLGGIVDDEDEIFTREAAW